MILSYNKRVLITFNTRPKHVTVLWFALRFRRKLLIWHKRGHLVHALLPRIFSKSWTFVQTKWDTSFCLYNSSPMWIQCRLTNKLRYLAVGDFFIFRTHELIPAGWMHERSEVNAYVIRTGSSANNTGSKTVVFQGSNGSTPLIME